MDSISKNIKTINIVTLILAIFGFQNILLGAQDTAQEQVTNWDILMSERKYKSAIEALRSMQTTPNQLEQLKEATLRRLTEDTNCGFFFIPEAAIRLKFLKTTTISTMINVILNEINQNNQISINYPNLQSQRGKVLIIIMKSFNITNNEILKKIATIEDADVINTLISNKNLTENHLRTALETLINVINKLERINLYLKDKPYQVRDDYYKKECHRLLQLSYNNINTIIQKEIVTNLPSNPIIQKAQRLMEANKLRARFFTQETNPTTELEDDFFIKHLFTLPEKTPRLGVPRIHQQSNAKNLLKLPTDVRNKIAEYLGKKRQSDTKTRNRPQEYYLTKAKQETQKN